MKTLLLLLSLIALNKAYALDHSSGMRELMNARHSIRQVFNINENVTAIEFNGRAIMKRKRNLGRNSECKFQIIIDRHGKHPNWQAGYDQANDYRFGASFFTNVPYLGSDPFSNYISYRTNVRKSRTSVSIELRALVKGTGWRLGIPATMNQTLILEGLNLARGTANKLTFLDDDGYDGACEDLEITYY
jgi:hypothetical protein